MSAKPVRYVFALVRAFAADTTSGGRDRTVILGSDGSEVSWDGDRVRVVEPDREMPAPSERATRYVEAMMTGAAA